MSKAYYDIYINQVMQFANTLVIQSSATADAMNKGIAIDPVMQARGVLVNPDVNSSWKYYMNLQGLYHPADTPMSIISLDTLQTIPFTVNNLQTNRATARDYVYGSASYNALVERFPTQENLIRGILNPVTLTFDADGNVVVPEDGTILYYDQSLVESNEENFIPELQKWFYAVFSRWDNRGYTLVDDLYAAAQFAGVFAHVVPKILNIRFANCKTRFVHSFHVTQYLASNGSLDAYVDTLSKAQQLWLYRNIQYIKRNAGKQSTFKWLIANILTQAGLPLAEWNMAHDTTNMPGDLLPTVEFARSPLNFGYSLVGTDTKTIGELFDLELPEAKDNPIVEVDDIASATAKMQNSSINALKTKVLESAVTDLTDASPYTFTDCLLNQWMYWAFSGRYSAVVNLTDPQTGAPFNMPVLDAFITYLYAYNMANGLNLVDIPQITANHVQRVPKPSMAELQELVDPKYISTNDLNAAINVLPSSGIYISTDAFYSACLDIQAGIMAGRLLYTAKENFHARGYMEVITQRCYCDVLLDLNHSSVMPYQEWFLNKGYQFNNYTAAEWRVLATQLVSEATGIDLLNIRNLKDLQGSMLALMAQLSSYSIQYIQTINTSTIKVIDWSAIRVGDVDSSTADLVQDGLMASDVLDVGVKRHEYLHDDLYMGDGLDIAYQGTSKETIAIDLLADITPNGNFKYLDRYQMSVIRFSMPEEVVQSLPDVALNLVSPDYVPLSLMSLAQGFNMDAIPEYLELTPTDRSILKQRFLGALSTPISSALQQFVLDGLNYPVPPSVNEAQDPLI